MDIPTALAWSLPVLLWVAVMKLGPKVARCITLMWIHNYRDKLFYLMLANRALLDTKLYRDADHLLTFFIHVVRDRPKDLSLDFVRYIAHAFANPRKVVDNPYREDFNAMGEDVDYLMDCLRVVQRMRFPALFWRMTCSPFRFAVFALFVIPILIPAVICVSLSEMLVESFKAKVEREVALALLSTSPEEVERQCPQLACTPA